MKLVINIPDAIKEMADEGDNKLIRTMWILILIDAIKNGVVLPKGHGRLIDESKIDWLIDPDVRWTTENRIKSTSETVIEADKEKIEMRTYHDIYREFSKKFPDYEVDDYRPADLSLVFKEVNCTIPNAIIVWLKSGEKLVYVSKEEGAE